MQAGIHCAQALEGQCNSPEGQEPGSSSAGSHSRIAAVVLYRTGNEQALSQSLTSIAEAADKIILIPSKQTKAELAALKTLPGAEKMLEHSITWEDSLAEARNAALDLAQASGKFAQVLLLSRLLHVDASMAPAGARSTLSSLQLSMIEPRFYYLAEPEWVRLRQKAADDTCP